MGEEQDVRQVTPFVQEECVKIMYSTPDTTPDVKYPPSLFFHFFFFVFRLSLEKRSHRFSLSLFGCDRVSGQLSRGWRCNTSGVVGRTSIGSELLTLSSPLGLEKQAVLLRSCRRKRGTGVPPLWVVRVLRKERGCPLPETTGNSSKNNRFLFGRFERTVVWEDNGREGLDMGRPFPCFPACLLPLSSPLLSFRMGGPRVFVLSVRRGRGGPPYFLFPPLSLLVARATCKHR